MTLQTKVGDVGNSLGNRRYQWAAKVWRLLRLPAPLACVAASSAGTFGSQEKVHAANRSSSKIV